MAKFGEQDLRSDYHFLGDAAQEVDRAKRQRYRDSLDGKKWQKEARVPRPPRAPRGEPQPPTPPPIPKGMGPLAPPRSLSAAHTQGQQKLVRGAEGFGVKLLLMPQGMSRHNRNNTRHHPRTGTITWRVEWEFASVEPEALSLDCCLDHAATWMAWLKATLIEDQPGKNLAVTRHNLRSYCEAVRRYLADGDGGGGGGGTDGGGGGGGGIRLFLRKEPNAANDPRYYAIDPRSSIKDSLAGKTVIGRFVCMLVCVLCAMCVWCSCCLCVGLGGLRSEHNTRARAQLCIHSHTKHTTHTEFPTVHVVLPAHASRYPLAPALITEIDSATAPPTQAMATTATESLTNPVPNAPGMHTAMPMGTAVDQMSLG